MSITIREKSTDAPLASGEEGIDALKYEGNWYFDPSKVDHSLLKVTERTYTCPSKGVCNWVDYLGPEGQTAKDVAWVYPAPKAGHEKIAGRFAFYAGSRGATKQD